jgi:hypothetical protein
LINRFDDIVEIDGKRYQVLWTNKPPGEQEPVYVEVKDG